MKRKTTIAIQKVGDEIIMSSSTNKDNFYVKKSNNNKLYIEIIPLNNKVPDNKVIIVDYDEINNFFLSIFDDLTNSTEGFIKIEIEKLKS